MQREVAKQDRQAAIQVMMSDEDVRAILGGAPVTDPTLLHTSTGFYKLNPIPIGKGGWGNVYEAEHYSLHQGKLVVSPKLAIKQMPEHQSSLLEKEKVLFQKTYPEQHFELFTKDNHAYLAMPLFAGVPLDKYLLQQGSLSLQERQRMGIELLADLNHIHQNGVTHHDIKPKNILYDPVLKRMHILDFGCAEKVGTPIKFNGIQTAKYAIEYMPPEYVAGMATSTANDIYSMTLSLAEILGINKRELVKGRMELALSSINDGSFKAAMRRAFELHETLDEAMFSMEMLSYHDTPVFQEFIRNYVAEQYDFSPYQEKLGEKAVILLNTMQAKDPKDRPSVQECRQQLNSIVVEPTHKLKAQLQIIQGNSTSSGNEDESTFSPDI